MVSLQDNDPLCKNYAEIVMERAWSRFVPSPRKSSNQCMRKSCVDGLLAGGSARRFGWEAILKPPDSGPHLG
jgi:hypothetical protein